MKRLSKYRVIITGNLVDIREYERPILYGCSYQKSGGNFEESEEEKEKRQKESFARSIYRSRVKFISLVNANAYAWKENDVFCPPVFVTLTFAENLQDRNLANPLFTKFIKQLNYEIYKTSKSRLKYITVIEFQDRGAVHYHILFFNFPIELGKEILKQTEKRKLECKINRHSEIKTFLDDIWGNGFVDVKNIQAVDNIGLYTSKYMSKDFAEKHEKSKRRYFPSRGLKKPIFITDPKKCLFILQNLPDFLPKKVRLYPSKYQGVVKSNQYNLGIGKTLSDFVAFPFAVENLPWA